MAKVLTTAQIEALKDQGAEIVSETEIRSVTLDEIVVEQFRRIADANAELAKKQDTEIVGAINELTRVSAGSREPLGHVIEALREAVQSGFVRLGYTHTVERNSRGLITRIKSTPDSLA